MHTHFFPQYLTFLDFNFNPNYPISGILFHKIPIILHTANESIIMFFTFSHDAQLCTHTDTYHKYAYLILVKCTLIYNKFQGIYLFQHVTEDV